MRDVRCKSDHIFVDQELMEDVMDETNAERGRVRHITLFSIADEIEST